MYDHQRALELLRSGTGNPAASFREGQDAAIRHIVEGRGRLLVIQRTGWGKSFVYFAACKLLREAGRGITIIVSPLLALMRNQLQAAARMGVRAVTINSDNEEEWTSIEASIRANDVDVVLISPERLANARFRSEVLDHVRHDLALLVIDEAHCISDWGHDFRPDYRRIQTFLRTLPATIPVLATTATANTRVEQDLHGILGPNLSVMRGSLHRPSLTLQTVPVRTDRERLLWIAKALDELKGHGIIYVLTVKQTTELAEQLRARGHNVEAYSGKTLEHDRVRLEDMLLQNQVKALVATNALGMGFDKPDLSFVIHYEMPGSVVGYYQQVGRAGRALPSAHGVILYGTSELNTLDYFIKAAFPRPNDVDRVVGALDAYPNGLTREALQQVTRMQYQSLDRVLNTISKADPSPIAVADGVWTRTGQDLHPSYWTRVEHITRLRREEIDEMQRYVRLPFGQHMQFLVRTLGGDPADVTTPPSPPLVIDSGVAVSASTFDDTEDGSEEVRSFDPTVIKPRRQWPYRVGYKEYNQYGKIPREYQASRGKVLGALDDQAWTKHLYECRQRGTSISEELIAECIAAIRSWNPAPRPTWVTGIPSLRHPSMVSDFARAIANGLGLPFHMVLERTADRPEQRIMQEHRKTDRGTNLDDAFGIATHAVPRGNVILIDDIVYSRWTMTIAAWLLRSHGAGQVYPFAVAQKIEQPSTEQPRWGGRRRWGR